MNNDRPTAFLSWFLMLLLAVLVLRSDNVCLVFGGVFVFALLLTEVTEKGSKG